MTLTRILFERVARLRFGAWLLAALLAWPTGALYAQDAAAPAAADTITVKLVTDFESAKLVSDLEKIEPVVEVSFSPSGPRSETKGVAAELWVRNAHVDGKFFFERYYEGKYIGREGQLTIARADLGVGEHVIEPGGHRFSLAADGTLSSDDPSIRVDGSTVMLRLHRVTIMGLDDARSGAPLSRLVGAEMGLYSLKSDVTLDVANLPNYRETADPRDAKTAANPMTNMLSHAEPWYPLSVWLPANTVGQGYVLFPSWQTFQVTDAGEIVLSPAGAPQVPGVSLVDGAVLIPFRNFTGRVETVSSLNAGVGNVAVGPEMKFSATLATVNFRAGFGKLDEAFALPVNTDFATMPNKYFVADNLTGDHAAIRLMALEWADAVLESGAEATLGLRLLETPEHVTLQEPTVRVRYSHYDRYEPAKRVWNDAEVIAWVNGRETGRLRLRAPELPPGFVILRVEITDAKAPQELTSLWAELPAAIVASGQTGSASFASDLARDAFQVGETIALELILRSATARPAGARSLRLTLPDGSELRQSVNDDGATWSAIPLEIGSEQSRGLPPGRYTLTVADLPAGVVATPFVFDLVPAQRQSLYDVIKPSKYTRDMNNLVPSHLGSRVGEPVDLDRATATIADLGYNKIDLMTYITNHHVRTYDWREKLASGDPRLPAPAAVYQPKPRTQILNGAVRHGLLFSDVQLSYNDFWIPRYIQGYTDASARWFARELQDMRQSPAMDGIMIYEEKYEVGISGIVEGMQKQWADWRMHRATRELGMTPAKIEGDMQRYVARPKSQRDPEVLQQYLKYGDWVQHSWADFVNHHAALADVIAPNARIGTYHRIFQSPGESDVIYHGYIPDLFKNLDIVGQVHYADNSTGWVHVPMVARVMRTGQGKYVVPNTPVVHESRTHFDGQYQRLMGFAMLAQGANGVSLWGVPHDFSNGPNLSTLKGRETTKHMNERVLKPYGELVNHAQDGYAKVGIVSVLNANILAPYKNIAIGHQSEEIWVSCWRAGYVANFLREADLEKPLTGYQVIFVPNIRFDGELTDAQIARLQEAIAAGTKVVVEKHSELQLEGVIHLDDWELTNFYLGKYFPTWQDDELYQVYSTTDESTAYLKQKFAEWGTEPAGVGDFQVGPSWWKLGAADYLIMANYNDPPYGHTVKQQMAEPIALDLAVPARHGAVAYDLLSMQELPLGEAPDFYGHKMRQVLLDMKHIQGALVAFLPARIGGLRAEHARSADGYTLKLGATLLDADGAEMAAGFPAEIQISRGGEARVFYRTLGLGRQVTLDLPTAAPAGAPADLPVSVRVIERISGKSVGGDLAAPTLPAQPLTVLERDTPRLPFPADLGRFLAQTRNLRIVVPDSAADLRPIAADLVQQLAARGVTATVVTESESYVSAISGDPTLEDPRNDGFHTWRSGQHLIAPGQRIDSPVILLGGLGQSLLLRGLVESGFISIVPHGGVGAPARPSVQLATRGLSPHVDTLCLIGDTPAAVQACVQRVLEGAPAAPGARSFGAAGIWSSAAPASVQPPTARGVVGNNSLVNGIDFDKDGNIYLTTWGHGDNFYSLAPDGTPRFHRLLPEMGAVSLRVPDENVFVYTRAGARLYRMNTKGEMIWQARLNRDPGSTHYADNYHLSTLDYSYLPKQQRILHKMQDSIRVLDMDLAIQAEWQGEHFVDQAVSDDVMTRRLGALAVSPDGARIAQVEKSFYYTKDGYKDEMVYDKHVVLRDLNGKLLAEFKDLMNVKAAADAGESVEWPEGEAGPIVMSGDRRIRFSADLEVQSDRRGFETGYYLGGGKRLLRLGRRLLLVDELGRELAAFGPFALFPTLQARSRDNQRFAFMDEYGRISAWDAADGGRELGRWQAPELGEVLKFTPDAQAVVLGGLRGAVFCWSVAGELRWQQDLKPLNDTLKLDRRPLYDPSIPDRSEQLWPRSYDRPGELEQLVRLGENRLQNGDMESDAGWQGGAVAYPAPGHGGKRSLLVGAEMLGQEVTEYLGRHVTWVLEFQYRAVDAAAPATLLAGMRSDSRFPDSAAQTLEADGQWRFARLVLKNGLDCERLAVGFLAKQGQVLVDDVSLRQIRFPSVNHLFYEPLYMVKPVTLTRMYYSTNYDPFGNVREEAPNRVLVTVLQTGTPNMVESAFLQNGRLNDIGSKWFVQPFQDQPAVSMALKEPRWINMAVVYCNVYDSENVIPHFDIFATNMETKQEQLVASVRNNTQLFRIVKFDPIKTPMITLRMVDSIRRLRTITEVELYGPLSGQEGVAGFLDPQGQNTYMGSFSRVDPRPMTVANPMGPMDQVRHGHGERDVGWQPAMAQLLAADDTLYMSRALGIQDRYSLPTEAKGATLAERGRANALGFTPYGSLYGGLLLRHGNDGRLYCISPETGAALWNVKLGERLYGCGVALGEDVYAANETGRLYQIDLANGSIMRDTALPGGSHGSMATDGARLYLSTDDGQLVARSAKDLSAVWAVPVAPESDSTPAVDGGVVYFADMRGRAIAVNAESGKLLWETELGREFTRCPLVLPRAIAYGCRDGMLVLLDRATGKKLWERQLATRFQYEPLWVNGDQLLVVDGGEMKLLPLDGKGEPVVLTWFGKPRGSKDEVGATARPDDPIVSLTWYKGHVVTVPRHGDGGHTAHQVNYAWHVVGGSFNTWTPPPPPPPPPPPEPPADAAAKTKEGGK